MKTSILRIFVAFQLVLFLYPLSAQQFDAVDKGIKSLKKQFQKEHYILYGDSEYSLDEALRRHVEYCQNEDVDEVVVTVTSLKKNLLPMLLLSRAAQSYAMRQQIFVKQKSEQYISLLDSDNAASEIERFTNIVNAYAEYYFKDELTLSFIVYRLKKEKQSDGTETEIIEAMGFYAINSQIVFTNLFDAIERASNEFGFFNGISQERMQNIHEEFEQLNKKEK